jgi:hypothetical protein
VGKFGHLHVFSFRKEEFLFLSFKAVDPAIRLDRIECLITEVFAGAKRVTQQD